MTDAHLRQFYDRWDRLEQDKAALQADLRELFAEMKGEGYDAKAARLAFRTKAKQDDETDADRAFDATVEAYVAALGTPVATRAPASAHRAHETPHDPETGEVTVVADGGQHFDAGASDYTPAEDTTPAGGEREEDGRTAGRNPSPADQMPEIPDFMKRGRAA